jgi:hypothetical protein
VPALSTLPAGLASGGATDKTTSGYDDALLTGRWKPLAAGPGGDECISNPATHACAHPFSLRIQLGYSASGLTVTRINEITYFNAVDCQAANQLGTLRVAREIQFDAADAVITDQSDAGAAAGSIAVRRGVVTADRFHPTSLPDVEALFAPCNAANPPTTPVLEEACSREAVALRIESSAEGPVLVTQEDFECQPGITPPPTVPISVWHALREGGTLKQP